MIEGTLCFSKIIRKMVKLLNTCLTQALQFDIKKLGTSVFIFSLGILPSILKLKYSNPITLKVKRP